MGAGSSGHDYFPKRANGEDGRVRTDLPCAGVLLFVMLLMGGVVGYSAYAGDTRRLTHGFDYNGRLCGADPEVRDRPFLYFCGSQERRGEFPGKLHFWSKSCVAACPTNDQTMVQCLMRDFHNFTELPRAVVNNITFLSTLNVEITQSVTLQKSYPTETYKEHFCVPQYRSNSTLRDTVIDGPLRHTSRLSVAVGSFRRAWPVVLGVAVLAVLIGMAYLYVLNKCAGLLIFASLCISTVLMVGFGIFFMIGVFWNPWDESGGYQEYNPIFRTFYGREAQAYSFLVGVILCCIATWMALTTYYSVDRIDEAVGVIQAACDCIFAPGALELLLQPLIQGVFVMLLISLLFFGLMQAASVGYLDSSGIHINGKPVSALERKFVYPWFWWMALTLYLFGSFWLLELAITVGQYVVSHAVCEWFFNAAERVEDAEDSVGTAVKETFMGRGSHVGGVEVRGVDNYLGTRSGYIQQSRAGEKVLVVPLGVRGPDGKDFLPQDMLENKSMPPGACLRGACAGLIYHSGSLAMGSLVSPFTRPLRWVSMVIRTFMGKAEKRGRYDEEDRSPTGIIIAGFSLFATLIDNLVGGFSKSAYVDIVLGSSNYCDAAKGAFTFIVEAGGAVAFLHGSTALYEVIAVVCITSICAGTAFILMTKIDAFRDPSSDWYISDPWTMTVLSSGICCVIAFSFMSLFNIIADTLLYVFAWTRKHHGKDIQKFVPQSLRGLVGHEMQEEPNSALQPSQVNQLNRFSHAASKYAGTIMASVKGGSGEGSPLLSKH